MLGVGLEMPRGTRMDDFSRVKYDEISMSPRQDSCDIYDNSHKMFTFGCKRTQTITLCYLFFSASFCYCE